MGLCSSNNSNSSNNSKFSKMGLLRLVDHGHSKSWFKLRIWRYLGPNASDTRQLRSYCRLFRDSLDPPLWTSFPHPNYPTLKGLMSTLNSEYVEYVDDPSKAPKIVYIKKGTFHIPVSTDKYGQERNEVTIDYPMMVIGAGQDKTTIYGGFVIRGKKEEGKKVVVQDVTMMGSGGLRNNTSGLRNHNGLSFVCERMTFTQCDFDGVDAYGTKARLINCVVTQCAASGIFCSNNALIELEGSQTTVNGNGTKGYESSEGLGTNDPSSRIHLLSPLTKKSVSTNNHGGRNYGGPGTFKTVDTFESF